MTSDRSHTGGREAEAMVGRIAERLSASGLVLRGSFDFGERDAPPPGPDGAPARAVLLVGQAGAAPWPHFQTWLGGREAGILNPLDTWCREVIGDVALSFGARAVSPSDRPYLPFQQWAMRAEGLRPSPLGILMHPDFGLWHAYRGALLFSRPLGAAAAVAKAHLCDGCTDKPCLTACPVAAHSGAGFAYADCLAHVRGAAGGACRERGCLDRNACPYGTSYRYPREVQQFHMAAFSA